jgi:anti-sigma-K factor RskA
MLSEHVLDLLPEYSLDLLEGGEREQVEAHLATCSRCSAELMLCQQLFTDLPLALQETEPPADIKERLLRAVRPDRPDRRQSSWKLFTTRINRTAPAWGFAALLVVGVLFLSNLLLWRQVSGLKSAASQAMPVITLSGVPSMSEAHGTIVMSKDGKYGTLVVSNLLPLNYNQQYQLWLIKDGHRTNGGVFSVDYAGYGALIIHSAVDLADFDSFGVTIEPYGGSPAPTGERVLGSNANG